MSIRKKIISLTSPFTSLLPLDMLCAMTGQHFIIPFYHIVSDEPCPHISNLYRHKGTKEFESEIDYLATNYQPLSVADLTDILDGKYKGKKTMLLTFDDGLRQMYDVVTPILCRKGIPAVFFLNTDFIDNKALMFRYAVSLMIGSGNLSEDAISSLRAIRSQEQFSQNYPGNNFDEFLRDYRPYMTTEQIRSLISQGFAIGSHSCSHPYYEDLTLTQQLSQTIDSLNILQRDFDLSSRLFAFPFTDHGVSAAFFDEIFKERKVDFSFGGAGIKHDIHPRQFQRVPMEGWKANAGQTLKSEYLYYLLRMPLFKNRIKRA